MKDIVTFETAVRLKEAGFPQPAPEAGQFWYGKNREVGYIFYHERLALLSGDIVYFDAPEKCVFAPTATDILREMPGCILAVENLYKETAIVGVYYEVLKTGRLLSDHGNPAEAVAEAWLKLNEKI